jgi:hypothetical protein
MSLPRGPLKRALYAVFFSIAACAVGGWWWTLYQSQPDGTFHTVLRFVLLEFVALLLSVLALAIIWCLFTPRWVEGVFNQRGRLLIVATMILGFGLSILILLTGVVDL